MNGQVPEVVEVKPRRLSRKFMNPREYRTAKNHIESVKTGKNTSLRQSAIKAGYAASYAGQAAKRVGEMLSANESIKVMMDREGIGLDVLVKDIKELREAKLPPHKDGTRYEDNFVRLETAKFRAKIQDALPTPTLNVNERKIVINLTGDDVARAKRHLSPDDLKELSE